MNVSDFAIPVIFVFVLVYGLCRKTDIFTEFTRGVKEGISTVLDIFPALFTLVLSVGMFRASGGLALISALLSPVTNFLGFPGEVTPLVIMRPFSGSGSVAIFESVLGQTGPDSYAGRVASVILGSSETTFYVIAVYFAATKVRKTRHALPSALAGDLTLWILSGLVVGLWFY
ncbi:MAG: spore maturation protein [Oscillospiraceae bacterium]|jgi:spore maturation protein B|nr:spore maturation protein [Oscillospiraceae bacterium]